METRKLSRRSWRHLAPGLVAVAALFAASPAWSQALVVSAGDNPTLQSLARNIVSICPRLAAATPAPGDSAADLADLNARCAAAVRTANSGAAATAAAVLGQIAPDELIAQDAVISGGVQGQTAALAGRIAALGGAGAGRQSVASLAQPRRYAQAATTASDARPDASVSRTGRFDAFATAFYGYGEKDSSRLESGFEADSWSLLGGADYGFTPQLTAGAAVGYADIGLDFSAGGGALETKAWTVAAYGAFASSTGFYSSATAAYSWIDYSSDRRIRYTEPAIGTFPAVTVNRVARGETNARQYEGTLRGGYTLNRGALSYGPSASATYRKLEIDGFKESGAQGLDMDYRDQDTDSLLLTLGGDVAWTVSTGGGIVTPYVNAAYVYEALDDKRTIDMFYRVDPFVGGATSAPVIRVQTSSPDRSRFQLGGGVSLQFAGGFSGFADVQTVLGQDDVSNYGFAIGLRKEF